MRVRFRSDDLLRLYAEPKYTAGHGQAIVRGYRKRMQLIVDAHDTRDLSQMRSNNFEKLHGGREGQFSVRINDQWRLILELEEDDSGQVVVIVGIADYH